MAEWEMAVDSETSWQQQVQLAVGSRCPSGLIIALSDALYTYATRYDTPQWREKREAVQRMIQAGQVLRQSMARADAAFGLENCPHPPSSMFSSVWHELENPVDKMVVDLKEWMEWMHRGDAPRTQQEGNPHSGRARLRLSVFRALYDADIPLIAQGTAGEVLAIVLAEADRIDGKTPRSRDEFSGTDWKRWKAEFNDDDDKKAWDALYAEWKASGLSMKEWAKQYEPTPE
jgi:hypothetical protein